MFVLKQDYTYEWPVDVKVPAEGKHQIQRFNGKFKVLAQEEAEAIVGRGAAAVTMELLRKVFVGWGDEVTAEAGGPLAFNEANRDAMLSIPYVRIAIALAYYESILGEKWREKN